MKFTKTSEKQLSEFFERMDDNCCVNREDWLTDTFKSRQSVKALPPFVKRQERKNATMKNAKAYFNHHHNKRRMVCFALDIDAYKAFMFGSMRGREIPRNDERGVTND